MVLSARSPPPREPPCTPEPVGGGEAASAASRPTGGLAARASGWLQGLAAAARRTAKPRETDRPALRRGCGEATDHLTPPSGRQGRIKEAEARSRSGRKTAVRRRRATGPRRPAPLLFDSAKTFARERPGDLARL